MADQCLPQDIFPWAATAGLVGVIVGSAFMWVFLTLIEKHPAPVNVKRDEQGRILSVEGI